MLRYQDLWVHGFAVCSVAHTLQPASVAAELPGVHGGPDKTMHACVYAGDSCSDLR